MSTALAAASNTELWRPGLSLGVMGTGTLLFARFLGCRCFFLPDPAASGCFFPNLNFTGLVCAMPRFFTTGTNRRPC